MNINYYINIIARVVENYFANGVPMFVQRLCALAAIVLFSPVFVVVAIAIAINSRGPIIFRQIRVGEQGYRFPMYKFRSMYMPNDKRYRMPEKSDRDGICKNIMPIHVLLRWVKLSANCRLMNFLSCSMCYLVTWH